MIRLWLSRDSDVPLHEQLSAQLVLGILSRRLKPGDRLPSVRALARQVKIHPNTVSAVYQRLEQRRWLEHRTGSGVYVCDLDVDSFARHCFELGLRRGFSQDALAAAFARLTAATQAHQFIVVDADIELARILAAEIGEALGQNISATTHADSYACMLTTEATARTLDVPYGADCRIVRLNSLQDLLVGLQRPAKPVLIGFASRSHSVRRWAGTLLSALGFSADCVVLRDPAEPDWRDGLLACDIVAADVLITPELPDCITVRLVAQDSLAELQNLRSSGSDRDM